MPPENYSSYENDKDPKKESISKVETHNDLQVVEEQLPWLDLSRSDLKEQLQAGIADLKQKIALATKKDWIDAEKDLHDGLATIDDWKKNIASTSLDKNSPKKPQWFMDVINSFLDNPMVSEFKSAMYNVLAMFWGKDSQNKYYTLAQFSEVEKKMSRIDKASEGNKSRIEDRFGNKISYLSALRNIQPFLMLGVDEKEDSEMKRMNIFIWSSFDSQKIFLEHVIKDPKQIDTYIAADLKPIEDSKQETKNIFMIQWIDEINYPEGVKVEMKWEKGREYITIGTMIVPIINNEARFYMWAKGGDVTWEKILSFIKDEQWNISLSQVKNWKKYPSRSKEIFVDPTKDNLTQDDNKFNLWMSWVFPWLWYSESIVSNNNLWIVEQLLADWKRDLSLISKEQRTPDVLKQKLEQIKNTMLPYINEINKEEFIKREIKLAVG